MINDKSRDDQIILWAEEYFDTVSQQMSSIYRKRTRSSRVATALRMYLLEWGHFARELETAATDSYDVSVRAARIWEILGVVIDVLPGRQIPTHEAYREFLRTIKKIYLTGSIPQAIALAVSTLVGGAVTIEEFIRKDPETYVGKPSALNSVWFGTTNPRGHKGAFKLNSGGYTPPTVSSFDRFRFRVRLAFEQTNFFFWNQEYVLELVEAIKPAHTIVDVVFVVIESERIAQVVEQSVSLYTVQTGFERLYQLKSFRLNTLHDRLNTLGVTLTKVNSLVSDLNAAVPPVSAPFLMQFVTQGS